MEIILSDLPSIMLLGEFWVCMQLCLAWYPVSPLTELLLKSAIILPWGKEAMQNPQDNKLAMKHSTDDDVCCCIAMHLQALTLRPET